MKSSLRLPVATVLFCALFLLRAIAATALPPEPARNVPLPAWYQPIHCGPAAASRVAAAPQPGGAEFLLIDRQSDVASSTTVIRCAYRLCSEEGLENFSNLTVEFDPSYQKIAYSYVRVWRDGAVRDVLAGAEIKLIQQEKDLALNMYNGRVTALIMIPDLRVGDVVDYAFTRTGRNPVFGGRFVDEFSAGWPTPVRREHALVITPVDRPLSYGYEGSVPLSFKMWNRQDRLCYEWEGRNLQPVSPDPDAPSWYVPLGYVEISGFRDWAEVAAWAERLFRLPEPDPDVQALAAKLCARVVKGSGRWAVGGTRLEALKALALIDFVQRDVRYLGIEMGQYSHQPNAPGVVLRQRYGDCKDKARLLCALLQASGIRAEPVLVNTWRGSHIRGSLASPDAFNHVIVRIHIGGRVRFVDATQAYQSGDLDTRGLARETCGLVVAKGTDGLGTLPATPIRSPGMSVYETISVPSYSGAVHDSVVTVYRGAWADAMRAYLGATAPPALKRNFLNLFKGEFPQLVPTSDLTWFDDPPSGTVTVKINFDVPDLWTKVAAGSENVRAEFWPVVLRRFFQQPKSIDRTAPLAVEYPARVEEVRRLTMPDLWRLPSMHESVETTSFRYIHQTWSEGREIVLTDRWTSRADAVPVSDLAVYVAKLADVRRAADETLIRNLDLTRRLSAGGVHLSAVVVLFSGLCAGLLGVLAVARIRPKSPPLLAGRTAPSLGGWLILPTIGLVLGLLLRLGLVVRQMRVVLDERVWVHVSASRVPAYVHWGLFVSVETFMQAMLLAWTGGALVVWFRRARGAPAALMGLLAGGCVYAVFEVAITAWNSANGLPGHAARQAGVLITAVTGAAIWIPYLLFSKRVARTFVR